MIGVSPIMLILLFLMEKKLSSQPHECLQILSCTEETEPTKKSSNLSYEVNFTITSPGVLQLPQTF